MVLGPTFLSLKSRDACIAYCGAPTAPRTLLWHDLEAQRISSAALVQEMGRRRSFQPSRIATSVVNLTPPTLDVTYDSHADRRDTDRRAQAPWYVTKTEPTLSDVLAKLRRVNITARLSVCPRSPHRTRNPRRPPDPGLSQLPPGSLILAEQ